MSVMRSHYLAKRAAFQTSYTTDRYTGILGTIDHGWAGATSIGQVDHYVPCDYLKILNMGALAEVAIPIGATLEFEVTKNGSNTGYKVSWAGTGVANQIGVVTGTPPEFTIEDVIALRGSMSGLTSNVTTIFWFDMDASVTISGTPTPCGVFFENGNQAYSGASAWTGLNGQIRSGASVEYAKTPIPCNGTVRNWYGKCATLGSTSKWDHTMKRNRGGSVTDEMFLDTTGNGQWTGGTYGGYDSKNLTGSCSVQKGDEVWIESISTNSPLGRQLQMSFVWIPDTLGDYPWFMSGVGVSGDNTRQSTFGSSNWTSSTSTANVYVGKEVTISDFVASTAPAPSPGTMSGSIRRNNTTDLFTLAGLGSTVSQDSGSQLFSVGDTIQIRRVTASSATTSHPRFGVKTRVEQPSTANKSAGFFMLMQ